MPGTKKSQQISLAVYASLLYVITSLCRYFSPSAIAALGVAHSAAGHIVLDTPQPLAEPLGELVPCAPQPRLQRVFGNAKLLCCFARRVAFHFAQHKCCA